MRRNKIKAEMFHIWTNSNRKYVRNSSGDGDLGNGMRQ